MPGSLATRRRAEALTRNRRHVPRQASLAATHQHRCRGIAVMTRPSTPRRVTARLRAERRVLRAGDKAAATLPTPRRETPVPDPLRRVRRVAKHRHRLRQVARHAHSPTPPAVADFASARPNRSSPCSRSRSAPGACSMLARWTTARTRRNAVATQPPSSARRVRIDKQTAASWNRSKALASIAWSHRWTLWTSQGSLAATFHLRGFGSSLSTGISRLDPQACAHPLPVYLADAILHGHSFAGR